MHANVWNYHFGTDHLQNHTKRRARKLVVLAGFDIVNYMRELDHPLAVADRVLVVGLDRANAVHETRIYIEDIAASAATAKHVVRDTSIRACDDDFDLSAASGCRAAAAKSAWCLRDQHAPLTDFPDIIYYKLRQQLENCWHCGRQAP